MAFAATTLGKLGGYLGFPINETSAAVIGERLAAIEAITLATYRDQSVALVESYLTQLDAIAAAINTERSIDGSTLLPELRREYRRHVALLSGLLDLAPMMDTAGGNP